jgi:diguanylate cyclase (GGDEF)-like protein
MLDAPALSIRSLLSMTTSLKAPEAGLVLVVDDDTAVRGLIRTWLHKSGIHCIEASSGEQALAIIASGAVIDAIVLDVMMPGIDGISVAQRLSEEPVTAQIPILMLTAQATSDADVIASAEAGAIDHLAKPFSGPVLVAKVRSAAARGREARVVRTRLQFAEAHAAIDGLTGLYNRREFDLQVRKEAAYAIRHARPFALLLFDLDHFKAVNDTFGHEQGDRVLVHVADAIREVLRREDSAFRYGGEEFAALLRMCGVDDAQRMAERLSTWLKKHPIRLKAADGTEEVRVITFSGGVATADATNEFRVHDLVTRADAALYQAKREGRDATFQG